MTAQRIKASSLANESDSRPPMWLQSPKGEQTGILSLSAFNAAWNVQAGQADCEMEFG